MRWKNGLRRSAIISQCYSYVLGGWNEEYLIPGKYLSNTSSLRKMMVKRNCQEREDELIASTVVKSHAV